jgi:hypothetical protein
MRQVDKGQPDSREKVCRRIKLNIPLVRRDNKLWIRLSKGGREIMENRESPSMEQKKYVASVCPEYRSRMVALNDNVNAQEQIVSCEGCIHWNNGRCVIFDEVLTGIDQT